MYDYVGAPWRPEHALSLLNFQQLRVGNGGLSFRKRTAMLAVIENRDIIKVALRNNKTPAFLAQAEDIFFIFGLYWLNNNFSWQYKFSVPGIDVASNFSVEWASQEFTIFNNGDVFGVHQLPGGLQNLVEAGFYDSFRLICPDAVSVARKCVCSQCNLF